MKQLCHRLAYFPWHKLAHKHYDPKRVDYWHDRPRRFALRPYAIMEGIPCLVPSPPICTFHATPFVRHDNQTQKKGVQCGRTMCWCMGPKKNRLIDSSNSINMWARTHLFFSIISHTRTSIDANTKSIFGVFERKKKRV